MRNAACHPAFSQFVGDEERLVVGHVAWCVALFVNVAFHDGERVIFYRAVVSFGEYRTFVINHVGEWSVCQLREQFCSFFCQRKLSNAVPAVVVFYVNGLCTVDAHASIVGSVREKIGTRTDAQCSFS